MFGPSWIHEKGEKTDGPVYEEIFCKSKSFATRAEDINICIFWKTSATLKRCSLQQK